MCLHEKISYWFCWCCNQGTASPHKDSKKQREAEDPRLTTNIHSSRMAPKTGTSFLLKILLSMFIISMIIKANCIHVCCPKTKQSFIPQLSLAELLQLILMTLTTSLCLHHVPWEGGKSYSHRPPDLSVFRTVTYTIPQIVVQVLYWIITGSPVLVRIRNIQYSLSADCCQCERTWCWFYMVVLK